MNKKYLAVGAALLLSGVVHANSVDLQRGSGLHEQVRAIVLREGYSLAWRLPVDATADEAAHPYPNWIDAIYGATKQLSSATTTQTNLADLAVPVVCDASKTIVITTLRDARQVVKSEATCHDLK